MLSCVLGSEGARLLAGALDTLSISAIILDGFGQIVAMTPAAEAIVRSGELMRTEGPRILAALPQESAMLERGVQRSLGVPAQGASFASEFAMRGLRDRVTRIRVSP